MPKQIYGHKAPVIRRQSSSSKEELGGYLTLAPALTAAAERTRLAAAELAVADVLLEVDDAMRFCCMVSRWRGRWRVQALYARRRRGCSRGCSRDCSRGCSRGCSCGCFVAAHGCCFSCCHSVLQ